MDFTFSRTWLPARIVTLALSGWLCGSTLHSADQVDDRFVKTVFESKGNYCSAGNGFPTPTPRSPQEPRQSAQNPENSVDRKDDKAEPAAESEPSPPTADERELVQRLLLEADAPTYKVRRSAQVQLMGLGHRLPVILTEVSQPDSVEAKAAVRMALRKLEATDLTKFTWLLTSTAKAGRSLGLKPSTITFYKDNTFHQSGPTAPEPETWKHNKRTKELVMDFNGGFAIYTGKEDEDGNFAGTAKNSRREWLFRLERLERIE